MKKCKEGNEKRRKKIIVKSLLLSERFFLEIFFYPVK